MQRLTQVYRGKERVDLLPFFMRRAKAHGMQHPRLAKVCIVQILFDTTIEISELMKDKDVMIVYHHLSRNGTHEKQISIKASELREHIAPTGRIFALRFRPYSPRAYFIITNRLAENRVRQSFLSFMQSTYGKHWDSYYEESPPLKPEDARA